eukprot:1855975-Pleurochrysis_carterae.AAC.2
MSGYASCAHAFPKEILQRLPSPMHKQPPLPPASTATCEHASPAIWALMANPSRSSGFLPSISISTSRAGRPRRQQH